MCELFIYWMVKFNFFLLYFYSIFIGFYIKIYCILWIIFSIKYAVIYCLKYRKMSEDLIIQIDQKQSVLNDKQKIIYDKFRGII